VDIAAYTRQKRQFSAAQARWDRMESPDYYECCEDEEDEEPEQPILKEG
jgi:hypothetical protein